MPDSAEIAQQNRQQIARRQAAPRTEYVLRLSPDDYSSTDAPPGGGARTQAGERLRGFTVAHQARVNNSTPITGFLTSPHLISGAWMAAMAVVSVDEWKQHHILPRPSRLWWTTMTYALLGVLAMSDLMAPLAGALAVGYTIMLIWQYYNGSGQFTTEATLV